MIDLNERERAAILLYIIDGVTDRPELFRIAEGEGRFNKLKDNRNSLKSTACKWFNSHKIQTGIEYYNTILTNRKNKIIQEYEDKRAAETEGTKQDKTNQDANGVNFLNPDEFLKFANQQANEIKDEKERREYLKMIANLMNYKEGDQEQTDIQRFYTPVLCENCAIYNKCKGCKVAECNNI